MADRDPLARSWFHRGCSRLVRALDPEVGRDRERTRAALKLVKEWQASERRTARAEARRFKQLEAAVKALTRESAESRSEVTRVRLLVSKQRERMSRLVRAATLDRRGLEEEDRITERLTRVARSSWPVIVGPWTGEVGFELLYWIPFLQWIRATIPIDPDRLIVVSRGGVQDWYGHVSNHYEEIFRYVTPAEFQSATEERKKQRGIRPFDRRLVKHAMRARGIRRAHLLHPTQMYSLFNAFWRYQATVRRLEAFTRYQALPTRSDASSAAVLKQLPADYVAVRFYFSSCFPDTLENRQFATRIIDGLAAQTHVVLLNNALVVDDHRDFEPVSTTRVHILESSMSPETNLAVQTAVIRGARSFVGTYGGYSYLAPLCGVDSVAFYSRQAFKRHHLELAQRSLHRVSAARLTPVDVNRATSLAEALGRAGGEGGAARPASFIDALRQQLEPLSWEERFERLALAEKEVAVERRPIVEALRAELAEAALDELSKEWGGLPLKEGVRRLSSKRMRGALGRAAKRVRDRRVVQVMTTGGLPLNGTPASNGKFAVGLDERAVELPLALQSARLREPGEVLDAGAALNLPVVRQVVDRPAARLTHFTLSGAAEPTLPGHGDRFAYAFGDLRAMPYRDASFDRVVCVSTLEHVGMDNARYGGTTEADGASASSAVRELVRVLVPGGELLITVPYGRRADHGWFRVLDDVSLHELLAPVAAEDVQLRFFYYEGGWAEGGPVPPQRVLDVEFQTDVITGVAVARVVKR